LALRLVGRGRIAVDGGYYSFDTNGKLNGCHYYIQDYQGNNRMVVNAATNRTEQVTHYYPYGELMADISTSPDAQPFKYSGKVLAAKRKIDNLSARRRALARMDRSFGLDLYDFHARQQDAKLGRFNSIDPHAKDYYGTSLYSYFASDAFERGTPKYQKADYGFSIEHKGVLCKVYLPVSVRQGNVKYLPFKNGNALWLKDLYPNRF